MENKKKLALPIRIFMWLSLLLLLSLLINSCGIKNETRNVHKRAAVVYLNGNTDTVEADITLLSDRDIGGFCLSNEGCLITYSKLRNETICCGVRKFKVID
jgi:hypothetical protein